MGFFLRMQPDPKRGPTTTKIQLTETQISGILQRHEAGATSADLAHQTRMPHQRNVIR